MTVLPSKKKLSLSKSTKAREETSPSAKWKVIKKGISKTKSCSRRNKGREYTKAHSSPQLQALQGALDCPGCEYAQNVSNSMMLIDETVLKTYNTSSYPYHFINKITRCEDIDICPLSTEPQTEEIPTFWEDIPASLRKCYYEQLEVIIDRYTKKGAKLTEYEIGHLDEDEVVLLAHYQMDYHIQQHYVCHRSWVNLCRDENDLRELQSFQWKMAVFSGAWDEQMKANGLKWREGWANDYNRGFEQQTEYWKEREYAREKQTATAKAHWAYIQKLRRMQRRQKMDADAETQTFRLYLGPRLLRTVEVVTDTSYTHYEARRMAKRYAYMMGDLDGYSESEMDSDDFEDEDCEF
ncbi:hypothetical protein N7467_011727 [Penicillium canescens]|nr:hypothetical protein N7467_011727 [Penicillium canescens]